MYKWLNIGCSTFKLSNFINIDIDPSVNPDLVLDLNDLDKKFEENSVDFIFAGHVFEHFDVAETHKIIEKCAKVLKPYCNMISVVPDYSKCSDLKVEDAERIILAGGQHKMLMNSWRLQAILRRCGFNFVSEITELKNVPYLVVPNINDPKPEPWQTAVISFKY